MQEFADGGDLAGQIERLTKTRRYLAEELIWTYAIQALEGLAHLHSLGILHRDLKPANIMLCLDGTIKLGDLNVSKLAKFSLVKTQIGTPYYMSPEIWNNKPYGDRSDMWALGCVIYELAALKPPFRGRNVDELSRCVQAGHFTRVPAHYSKDLESLIDALLRKNARQRPSAAALLKSALITAKRAELRRWMDETRMVAGALDGANMLGTIAVPARMDARSVAQIQLPSPQYHRPDARSGRSFEDSDGRRTDVAATAEEEASSSAGRRAARVSNGRAEGRADGMYRPQVHAPPSAARGGRAAPGWGGAVAGGRVPSDRGSGSSAAEARAQARVEAARLDAARAEAERAEARVVRARGRGGPSLPGGGGARSGSEEPGSARRGFVPSVRAEDRSAYAAGGSRAYGGWRGARRPSVGGASRGSSRGSVGSRGSVRGSQYGARAADPRMEQAANAYGVRGAGRPARKAPHWDSRLGPSYGAAPRRASRDEGSAYGAGARRASRDAAAPYGAAPRRASRDEGSIYGAQVNGRAYGAPAASSAYAAPSAGGGGARGGYAAPSARGASGRGGYAAPSARAGAPSGYGYAAPPVRGGGGGYSYAGGGGRGFDGRPVAGGGGGYSDGYGGGYSAAGTPSARNGSSTPSWWG